jgi:hypothetical protein
VLEQSRWAWVPLSITEEQEPVAPMDIPTFPIPAPEMVDPEDPITPIRWERELLRVKPQSNGDGVRTIARAACVQFGSGEYMLYPEDGHIDLFAFDGEVVRMIKPDELDIGSELIWIDDLNELLRQKTLAVLDRDELKSLHQWRKLLEDTLVKLFNRDRNAMAEAMGPAGFHNPAINLARWLDSDMYAPQRENLERIIRFCILPEPPQQEMERMILEIQQANGKARDERKRVREQVEDRLNSTGLDEVTVQEVNLLGRSMTLRRLLIEDQWVEDGPFGQNDMYRILAE